MQQPAIRLEVRTGYYKSNIRYVDKWPLHSVHHQKIFLDAVTSGLLQTLPEKENFIRYKAVAKRGINKAAFNYQFDEETELTGGMNLRLWVSAEQTDDMDIFVVIKKLDSQGNEIYFSGYNGNPHDVVAKGWLRASHRELDQSRSTIEMPYHLHKHILKIAPNEVVPVDVEILPSSTLFEKGSFLQVGIMGQEPIEYNTFKHVKDESRI